jgi:hypothetical protein
MGSSLTVDKTRGRILARRDGKGRGAEEERSIAPLKKQNTQEGGPCR